MQKMITNAVILIAGGLILTATPLGLVVITAGATCIVALRRAGLVRALPAGN